MISRRLAAVVLLAAVALAALVGAPASAAENASWGITKSSPARVGADRAANPGGYWRFAPVALRPAPGSPLATRGAGAGRAGRSELGNALSDLGSNPTVRNIQGLDEFGPRAAFSVVYDQDTGRWLAYASGQTRLASGEVPANLVAQFGGHRVVDDVLSEILGTTSRRRFGLALRIDVDGDLRVITWNSGQINPGNPATAGSRTVPSEFRQEIMDAISSVTGRSVYTLVR